MSSLALRELLVEWFRKALGPCPADAKGNLSPSTDQSSCFFSGRIDKTMLASLKVK